jgi:hypothetical protein
MSSSASSGWAADALAGGKPSPKWRSLAALTAAMAGVDAGKAVSAAADEVDWCKGGGGGCVDCGPAVS